MSAKNELREKYRQVMDRVAQAAQRSGRTPKDIIVVAVTKNSTPEQLRQLMEMGHQDLGESRVQQLSQRVAMTQEFAERHRARKKSKKIEVPDVIRWHMIGHLQRNKVKAVLPFVKLIHSIDSLRLAEELQIHTEKLDHAVEVLIQVDASGEPGKHGVGLSAAGHLAEQMKTMTNIKVRGLMTMAPYSENPEDSRPVFQRAHETFEEICKDGICGKSFNILSMGMSNDFEVAIESGANIVRIGRALFGEKAEVASA